MFNPGDRVVLKAHYKDIPGVMHYDRDKVLGPRAKDAVGTVGHDDGCGSVVVVWDDPDLLQLPGRDASSWAPDWFDLAPHPPVDTSSIEAVERYLHET